MRTKARLEKLEQEMRWAREDIARLHSFLAQVAKNHADLVDRLRDPMEER
jgi:hypothetical protein